MAVTLSDDLGDLGDIQGNQLFVNWREKNMVFNMMYCSLPSSYHRWHGACSVLHARCAPSHHHNFELAFFHFWGRKQLFEALSTVINARGHFVAWSNDCMHASSDCGFKVWRNSCISPHSSQCPWGCKLHVSAWWSTEIATLLVVSGPTEVIEAFSPGVCKGVDASFTLVFLRLYSLFI